MVKSSRLVSLVVLVWATVAFWGAGCSAKRLDPQDPGSIPSAGDATARGRFDEARARFERDELDSAGSEFEAIARDFPQDPIAPYAQLYAGMAAYRRGDYAAAAQTLAPLAEPDVPDAVRNRARYTWGLAAGQLGEASRAVSLLSPFVGEVEGQDAQAELHAVLAEAYVRLNRLAEALGHYDSFYTLGRPTEQAYVVDRVAGLLARLDDAQARAIYDGLSNRGGVVSAHLAERVARLSRADGDAGKADDVLRETQSAREGLDLAEPETTVTAGQVDVVGALLPFRGRARLVGETAMRGLAVFSNAVGTTVAAGDAFRVEVRDSGEGADIAALVDELTARGAMAIIGPVDGETVQAAANRATTLGVPLISLDVASHSAKNSPWVFSVVLPVEARARALARHALRNGGKRFAILSPSLAYGSRASAAFRAEVEKGGGRVVFETSYDAKATSFVVPVKELASKEFDAVFIPDTAAKLELIAPQLAVFDLIVHAPGSEPTKFKRDDKGRRVKVKPIWLLGTAEGLSPRFLSGGGRYAQGAILAPGFYPDEADSRIGPYVASHIAAYGTPPTYLDAYAYDAALVVAQGIDRGATTRQALATQLRSTRVRGLTGELRFDADQKRADSGLLFIVTSESVTPAPGTTLGGLPTVPGATPGAPPQVAAPTPVIRVVATPE